LPGTLFIVATPIGNLEDLTLRALRVLREADVIACEDTRHTGNLLHRYELKKDLVSYYQPREGQRIPYLLDLLKRGKNVALVSDAGTPGISDPGFRLVREAIREGFPVVPIPGPSALITALCASGLPVHRFLFLGFAPAKAGALRKSLLAVKEEEGTIIFYLPARKIEAFLEAVLAALGDRSVVIAREITKVYEEFLRGTASEILEKSKGKVFKGEVTFLVHGAGE
jgi:16S rRNA (cytidine1402-2'-O)-methyltransferase